MFSTFFYENGEDISLYIVVTIDGFTNHKKSAFENLSNDFFSETKSLLRSMLISRAHQLMSTIN